MRTPEEIVRDYLANWQINGLGMLDKDDRQPWPVGGETVKNDNGILYITIFLRVASCIRSISTYSYGNLFSTAMDGLRSIRHEQSSDTSKYHIGLYDRRPSQESVLDSQDNQMAAANLNPMSTIQHGKHHLWNFNNVNPGKWKLEAQRQPGEVAYYYMQAKQDPSMFTFLYFCAGILLNAYNKEAKPFQHQLAWFRLLVTDPVYPIKKRILDKVRSIWMKKLLEKCPRGIKDVFAHYYRPEHPIHELVQHAVGEMFEERKDLV